MAVIEFTNEDVGKSVMDASGERVGRIVDTRGGTAYVDPDPNMVETITSKLGWSDADGETYELNGNDVMEVTGDEVLLDPI